MTVSHLHYTAWPDHGVPDNVMSLIAFIRHVRKLHPVSHQQPLLVHCSAGVGRTGTLILLDIIMQQMKTEGTISVLHWLRNLRMQRMMMVQSQVREIGVDPSNMGAICTQFCGSATRKLLPPLSLLTHYLSLFPSITPLYLLSPSLSLPRVTAWIDRTQCLTQSIM